MNIFDTEFNALFKDFSHDTTISYVSFDKKNKKNVVKSLDKYWGQDKHFKKYAFFSFIEIGPPQYIHVCAFLTCMLSASSPCDNLALFHKKLLQNWLKFFYWVVNWHLGTRFMATLRFILRTQMGAIFPFLPYNLLNPIWFS